MSHVFPHFFIGCAYKMDKAKEWQMELMMEKIRSKSGQFKSFVESAKALRMSLLASI